MQLAGWPGSGLRALLRHLCQVLGGRALVLADAAAVERERLHWLSDPPEDAVLFVSEVLPGIDLSGLLAALPVSSMLVLAGWGRLATGGHRVVRIEAEELLLQRAEAQALGRQVDSPSPRLEEWLQWTGGWMEPLASGLAGADRQAVATSLEAILDDLPGPERDALLRLAAAFGEGCEVPLAFLPDERPQELCGCLVDRAAGRVRMLPAWHQTVRRRLLEEWPVQRREAQEHRAHWLMGQQSGAAVDRTPPPAARPLGAGEEGRGFRVLLLGNPDLFVVENGEVVGRVRWPRRSAMVLFTYLVTRPGRRADRDELIEAVWRDADRNAARHRLHPTVSRLRRTLGGGEAGARHLLFRDGAYELSTAIDWQVDSELQEQRAAAAQAHAAAGEVLPAAAAWEEVVALHRGPFAAGLECRWVEGPRERARRIYLQAVRKLAELRGRLGATLAARECYETLLREEPLDETVHAELMRLHCGEGRRDLVHQRYAELCQLLADEVGAEPLASTTAIYRELLGRLG